MINLSIGEPGFYNISIIKKINKFNKLLFKYSGLKEKNYFKNSIIYWIYNTYKIKLKNNKICSSLGNREAIYSTSFILKTKNRIFFICLLPCYLIYFNQSIFMNLKCYKIYYSKYLILKNILKIPDLILKKTRYIFICNPNNPTGTTIKQKELKKIYIFFIKYNIYIILDECYSELYYKHSYCSGLQIDKEMKKLIILNSLSKRSSLPGLRSGFILSNKFIIKKLIYYKKYSGTLLSIFNQKVSSFLWKDTKYFFKRKKIFYKIINYINKKNIFNIKIKFGFYIWLNISFTKLTDIKISKIIYKKHNIKILPGSLLGNKNKNFIRIALVKNYKKCLKIINIIFNILNEKKH
ncbi:aminotransferase class I/II-fold pyridoxal phosphate-dependent enzyme [Candidatus Vidania fulgoroideorum]